MKYKVAIVDDHSIFREGFKLILNHLDNAEFAGEAANGEEFIEILKTQKIDIVFLDINMPILDGFETAEKVLETYPNLKIIVITSFKNLEYVNKMLDIGVAGYMLKDADYQEIQKAIDYAVADKSYLSNDIIVSLTRNTINDRKKKKITSDIPKFTSREMEVLKLYCNGFSKKEIAEKLFLSERTIEKHKENLMTKANINNMVSLVVFAFKNSIIELDQ